MKASFDQLHFSQEWRTQNMNATVDAGEPSSTTTTTTTDAGNPHGIGYDLGFSFIVIFFILTICYTSYVCKRRMSSQPPPPPPTSDYDSDDYHCTRILHQGLDDHILSTFPTFLYSELVVNRGSGCAICLADYKPADVIRLLPKCDHLFHRKCVDKWLKVHPTCPVCRNSPLPTPPPELT